MENGNRTELGQWVEQRAAVASPPPGWEPDVDLARARFHSRLSRRPAARRYWLARAAAASLICAVIVLVPGTRALAQQLWRWITVGRIQVVKVNFDNLPDEARSLSATAIARPGPPQVVADSGDAARRAGFVPRLPRPGVLSGAPRLSVLGPMLFGTVIRTADLELALKKAGVSNEVVPKQWDGAQLTVQIGSTVTAEWNDISLMQGLPAALSLPSGFDLGAFTTLVLRAVGMNREEALRFGRQLAAAPALLFGIAGEDAVTIREVDLHTGPATLIEDIGDNGRIERVTVLWSVPDRVYMLSGAISADLATAVANSID
jgi:hypothetical protein